MKFKYNGKLYNPVNPEKKLKKLGITWNDVEIIKDEETVEIEEDNGVKKYYFKNPNTGCVITSIYDNLDNLKGIIEDISEYDKIT